MTASDPASVVREGEELDVAALEAYLADGIPGFRGPLTVRQFPAGFSNLTYLLEAGSCEWVLRRPPRGTKPSSGHDMVREYRVLSGLQGRYPFAPAPVLLCEDSSVIGAPFYLAERLSGIILRRDYPPTIEATPTLVRAQQEALLDALAQLHAVDFECAGLGDLGQPAGYVQRQVSGWARRYERARTDDAPDATDLVAWLEHNRPPDTDRVALIHNDFKLDNVVFDRAQPARLTGVLDWEMATLGDPRMDLGCSLAYWVQADDPDWFVATRMLPTHLPGSLTRREAIERYEASAGRELRDMGFFYAFGVFRLSVIAQQIYLRYALGETKDPRFAVLGDMVRALLRGAGEAATGRLARA